MASPPRHDPLQDRRNPLPRPALRSAIAGTCILAEMQGPASTLLWEAYRAVHQWAATPPARRAELADPGAEPRWAAVVLAAGLEPAREDDLLRLGIVLHDPVAADPPQMALGLRALAGWAVARGAPQTAALLAEAAAHCVPGDPAAAYEAGFAANRAGWSTEAESWFRYGAILSRSRGELVQAALFLSSLGRHHYRRGNHPLAERLHLRALGMARRARSRGRAAGALHDLSILAGERGDLARAEIRARRAARLYGPEHERFPYVLHDLAYLWMIHGRFEAAHPLMRALLPHLRRPQERVQLHGNVARAAAGAGLRDEFEEAWSEVVAALRAHAQEPAWADALADALTEAAHGALTVGEPGRARWAAERGEPLARGSGRARERMELESLLDAARNAPAPGRPGPRPADPSPWTIETAAQVMELLAARTVHA